ncbi:FAD-dependent oxidoreductase [Amazonocrinis nigriterrae]|uniref:FAD-dependent oxidoreductase n=1 Tax=Amazonocrinis nigriterrae TaxID=2840443 RepID=UPI001CECC118|nr:FAD-dependent oxidoreductase [Amazonocrinis nigriterrae]
MKVTVVGAGIMGMSVAWALERDGHQVSVYEQTQILSRNTGSREWGVGEKSVS